MRIVAIVQARMGSTRLPGKVMREILGKPVLAHLITRLKESRLIEGIVIATSDKERDKPILKLARELGIDSFAGNEDDVLDRYYRAARKYSAEVIVRITADCPLIDPELVDKVVAYYLDKEDMVDLAHSGPSYPDGVVETEVFPFTAMEKAWKEAHLASEREHVTAYIWKNTEIFRTATLENEEDLSHIRLVVDDERDFQLVAEIFENLYQEGEIFHLKDIMNFLKKRPKLLELNKRTVRNEGYQKSLSRDRNV
ncbi:cytidylyltransferase domain-containing protein [Chloroflexota bacterium]